MHWLIRGFGLIVLMGVALAVWVRVAPTDAAYWHKMPNKSRDVDEAGGAFRVIDGDAATFAELDAIIQATPRTTVLAGSLEEGMVTYVTRTAVMGFPDYTTVQHADGHIALYGRLRYGVADLGVNAARLHRWLALLGQGGG